MSSNSHNSYSIGEGKVRCSDFSPRFNGEASLANDISYDDEVDEVNYFLPTAYRLGLDTDGGERGTFIRETVKTTPGGRLTSSPMQLLEKREGNYNMGGGGEGRCSRKLSIIIVTFGASLLLFGVCSISYPSYF